MLKQQKFHHSRPIFPSRAKMTEFLILMFYTESDKCGCIYVQVFELVCLQFDLWYQFRDNREQMSWALNLWVKIVHHLFHISDKQTTY